jgi:hypothetical protein
MNRSAPRFLEELAIKLRTPRKEMMMVPAGRAVDHVIERLTHVLEEGGRLMDPRRRSTVSPEPEGAWRIRGGENAADTQRDLGLVAY